MRKSMMAVGMAAGLAAGAGHAAAEAPVGPVIELRQYKIAPGKRDELIALFESNLIEGQEALGMELVGQFRDPEAPNRFTWIRSFPDMAKRGTALNAFYFGPVWQANRAAANPMLEDNDNVLLLKPAAVGSGFAPTARSATEGGVVVATIHYLWKQPTEGFDRFFLDRVVPELEAAGLPLVGAFVPENSENTFPRLPVRQGEKLFVWFTRADSVEAYERAQAQLSQRPGWRELERELKDHEERQAQVLHLDPTARSKLR